MTITSLSRQIFQGKEFECEVKFHSRFQSRHRVLRPPRDSLSGPGLSTSTTLQLFTSLLSPNVGNSIPVFSDTPHSSSNTNKSIRTEHKSIAFLYYWQYHTYYRIPLLRAVY